MLRFIEPRLRVEIGFGIVAGFLAGVACAPRFRANSFRVVPASPAYLLRSPDSHDTAFPEILRAYNNFEPGRGWMDLHAGMELFIENAYYLPGMSRRGLNGFLGTETARYKVQSHGGLQLAAVQSMKDRPSGQAPVQQLIHPFQMHYHYYRFYYEILFRRSGEMRGSVLLGANGENDIERMSSELLRDPDSVCGENDKNCTVFPEACSVSVEMEIVVNGAARNVIWGSLLSNVVDRPHHLELWRLYHGRLLPVKLKSDDANALRLPLLPGDHVKVR
jgi:hypothetical protein